MTLLDSELEEQGISLRLLGLGANSWTKESIWKMLDHYEVEHAGDIDCYYKVQLLGLLDTLVRERALTAEDRYRVAKAPLNRKEAKIHQIGLFRAETEAESVALAKQDRDCKRPVAKRPWAVNNDMPVSLRHDVSRNTARRTLQERIEMLNAGRKAIRKARREEQQRQKPKIVAHTTTLPATAFTFGSSAGVGSDYSAGEPSAKNAPSCIACLEILIPALAPGRKITNVCSHEPQICAHCLAQSIASQLDSKLWQQIDCPICSASLGYADVKNFATKATFQR